MIKYSVTYKRAGVIFMTYLLFGCIEPFEAEFVDFESALVIDATITNELKNQEIFLTRTYKFENDGPTAELNANVSVSDGNGNTYAFRHVANGLYRSEQVFAAQSGKDYELSVTSQEGRNYGSDPIQLTATTSIDEVSVERITNDQGEDGIAILVDSFDPTGNAKNYRYELIETYRVISPMWSPVSLIGAPEPGCEVIKIVNTTDERVCYPTSFSNRIVLTSTKDLEEDRVSKFMVRFINRDNYIISHRYSILVRQLVQSNEAYAFFETLNELSGSESLFSETQPGFLQGNVFSKEDKNETVLGFFDVASVSEKRVFFNYDDFYPGEPLPPYIDPCKLGAPPIADVGRCVLRRILETGVAIYYADNSEPESTEGPYFVVSRICGDCKTLGPTEIPDFWIE